MQKEVEEANKKKKEEEAAEAAAAAAAAATTPSSSTTDEDGEDKLVIDEAADAGNDSEGNDNDNEESITTRYNSSFNYRRGKLSWVALIKVTTQTNLLEGRQTLVSKALMMDSALTVSSPAFYSLAGKSTVWADLRREDDSNPESHEYVTKDGMTELVLRSTQDKWLKDQTVPIKISLTALIKTRTRLAKGAALHYNIVFATLC